MNASKGPVAVNGDILAGATTGNAIILQANSNAAKQVNVNGGYDVTLQSSINLTSGGGKILIYTGSIANSGSGSSFNSFSANPNYFYNVGLADFPFTSAPSGFTVAYRQPGVLGITATKTYDGTIALGNSSDTQFIFKFGSNTLTGLYLCDTAGAGSCANNTVNANNAHVAANGANFIVTTGLYLYNTSDNSLNTNYSLPTSNYSPGINSVTINPRSVQLNLPSSLNKTYDATTSIGTLLTATATPTLGAVSGNSYSGPLAGDTLNLANSISGAFNSAHVLNATHVTAQGFALNIASSTYSSQLSDYQLVDTSPTPSVVNNTTPIQISAFITPATPNFVGNKTYDGTNNIYIDTAVDTLTISGVNGETLSLQLQSGGTPSNVPQASSSTVTNTAFVTTLGDYQLANGPTGANQGLATDYLFPTTPAYSTTTPINQVIINAATLSVSAIKTYDGRTGLDSNTDASLTVKFGTTTLSNLYLCAAPGTQGVCGATHAPQAFSSQVGSNNYIVMSNLSLYNTSDDMLNNNYVLPASSYSSTANSVIINPKAINVNGLSASHVVYNGTIQATMLNGTASLMSVNVGSGSAIDGKYYSVDTITLDLGNITGIFNQAQVGNNLKVSLSSNGNPLTPGQGLTGSGAANYILQLPNSVTANITPKLLNVTGLALANSSVTYNGTIQTISLSGTPSTSLLTPVTPGSGSTADGKPYTGDNISLNSLAGFTLNAIFQDKNVGTNKPLTLADSNGIAFNTGQGLTGNDANNYILAPADNTGNLLTANITPKLLSLAGLALANSSVVYNGTIQTIGLNGTPAGLLSSEPPGSGSTNDGKPYTSDQVSLNLPASTLQAIFIDKNVGTNKTLILADSNGVAFNAGQGLTGNHAANYLLAPADNAAPLTATITPKSLSLSGLALANSSVIYNGTIQTINLSGTPSLLNAEMPGSGSVNDGKPYSGDNVSLSTSIGTLQAMFADKNVDTNKPLTLVNDLGMAFSASQGLTPGNPNNDNYILQLPNGTVASILPATLMLNAQSETLILGGSPSRQINIVVQSGVMNTSSDSLNPKLLLGDSITNVYAIFQEDYNTLFKIGSNCCVITVAPGYVINDGNAGRNYLVQIQPALGSINLPKTQNPGTTEYADITKQGPPWTNGRNASNENKFGALARTPDTKSWDITDAARKRMILSCSVFGMSANTEVCGRHITQKSAWAETRSYQPKIEFNN